MGFRGKWIFKCLGCKTKEQDDTEYIDLSKMGNVDHIIHINDLVVSKPDLYVDKPKSVFIERKELSYEGSRLGAVKPTIAIPIKSKWPSDVSSNDSQLKDQSSFKDKKDYDPRFLFQAHIRSKKVVVPLSNVPEALVEEYRNQQLTISQSIAIAENIYQNEKKQIMGSGRGEDGATQTVWSVETWKPGGFESKGHGKFKIPKQYTFSSDDSVKNTQSMSGTNRNESQEDQLTHICYMSEDEDDESLSNKIWNMFVSATEGLAGTEYPGFNRTDDEVMVRGKQRKCFDEGIGLERKGFNEREWIENKYKVTPQEASQIVEGAIENVNRGRW